MTEQACIQQGCEPGVFTWLPRPSYSLGCRSEPVPQLLCVRRTPGGETEETGAEDGQWIQVKTHDSRWHVVLLWPMKSSRDASSAALPAWSCITCWGRRGVWRPAKEHSIWGFWVWWSQAIAAWLESSKGACITCHTNLCSRLSDDSWALPWTPLISL